MRKRYIQDRNTGKLIPAEDYYKPVERSAAVYGDIAEYKSMQTGEMIGSRSHHREHLRRHGLIEVGNEIDHMLKYRATPKLDKERRRRDIAEALSGHGH